jgi:uncharacterized membrane protein
MYRVDTQIEINATAERVWSLLLDFAAYPRWNLFVRSIEALPRPGTGAKPAKIVVVAGQPNCR